MLPSSVGPYLQAAAVVAALGLAAAPAQEAPPAEAPAAAPAATTAAPDVLARLLEEHDRAARAKDALELGAVLGRMRAFDNPELGAAALDALRYKASPADRKVAKRGLEELGLTSRDDLERRLHLRESEVRAAAARVLANLPADIGAKALAKALRDKENLKVRPLAIASAIDALGRLGDRGVEEDVEPLLRRFDDEQVTRAAVLYFGRVRTTSLDVVLALCEQLAAPEPAAVDSPANPPASYWESRWKVWMAIRRDVSWSLQEITGQVFAPAEGGHEGDARKAREWVRENAKELGLR